MVDIAQFKANFGKHKIPDELLKLCEFQEATGFEELSDGFCLTESESGGLSSWSESKAFLDSVIEFAQANGSGSIYALWLMEPKGELSKQPVIVLGDEGGAHVVAENLKEFLRLLTLDTEPLVDWDEVSFCRNPDGYEPSGDLDEYIDWLDYTFNLKPIKSADEVLKATRKKYAKKFKQWASKFIDDIEAEDEDEDDDESAGDASAKRRFEFEEGNSSKFWEIQLDGESLTTCWGKIGTAGQSKTLDFDSEEEAKKQYDKLVAEKTKKGYEEVGGGANCADDDDDDEEEDDDDAPPPRAKVPAPVKAAPKPAAAPKKIPVPGTSGGGKRRFEFEEGGSSKFWEIELDGESLTTWWGKIGTAGQSKTLEFDSEAESQKQYDKLVAEKTKKGYEEVGGGAGNSDGDDDDDEEEDDAPPARAAAPVKAAAPKPQPSQSKPSAPSATASSAPAGDKRRFEFEEGGSSKFWEIQLGHNSLTTWWGKIGTAGQSKTLDFGSAAEAQKQYDKLVAEKTKKGYEEVD
jgi:predicted DNA-binding WGR domain protein